MDTQMNVINETGLTLVVTREFDAPRERVFDAWTVPDLLRKWIGPAGVSAPNASADAKIGGSFSIPMVNNETGEAISTATGTYTEVSRPDKLAFTWSWLQDDGNPGQLMGITLDFVDLDGRTKLTLTHINFIDEEAKEKHGYGWNGSFDCLADHLAA